MCPGNDRRIPDRFGLGGTSKLVLFHGQEHLPQGFSKPRPTSPSKGSVELNPKVPWVSNVFASFIVRKGLGS